MTKVFKADLHCHTTFSDGTSTPEEVITLAKDLGLSALSITDHDTVDAYERAFPAAHSAGIELITGVEFSSRHNNLNIHLLGYGFAFDNPHIKAFCDRHRERRFKRTKEFLKKLSEQGMPITEMELLEANHLGQSIDQQNICRPHIAMAMIKKGYVKTIQEAFKKYLSEGKNCYVSSEYPSVPETIDTIHQGGGIAVLAHPELINKNRVLRELLTMNFDGIEAYYGRMPKYIADKWLAIAKEKNWLVTGGSDYHGQMKPDFPLGSSWIDETLFRNLQNLIK